MPLDKYKLKLNEQNLSRFLNNLIFSILGFSDTKYKFNGEVLKYLQLWYLTWPWWGPKLWTPYGCPSWKPPICWNDAGIWLKLPWKTMARLDGNIKLWLATLICVNIQRSPFQTITSKNLPPVLPLYYRLKLLGILKNSTGRRIPLPVWKFILPVMLKIRKNTEYIFCALSLVKQYRHTAPTSPFAWPCITVYKVFFKSNQKVTLPHRLPWIIIVMLLHFIFLWDDRAST